MALFIVLDGMDGAGKTTQLSKLHHYLFSKDKRIRILTTREPTYGKFGKRVREMLTTQSDPYASREELFKLYLKDRKDHLKKTVLPFLKSEKGNLHIVLCDRYYYSTIAYQVAQGVELKKALKKNKGFLKPDLAIVLMVDPKTALERISGKRKTEKFENLEFMQKLQANFQSLREHLDDNILYADSSGTEENTFTTIQGVVDVLLQS